MDYPRRPIPLVSRAVRAALALFDDWQLMACVAAAILVCAALGAILVVRPLGAETGRDMQMPRYTPDGQLVRPERIEEWVFVGASLGLTYSDGAPADGPGAFHNVYITPAAYDAFMQTRTFPDGTMLAMTIHLPGEKTSPGRNGVFEGRRVALEIAVKDPARFPERWAYFPFGSDRAASARRAGPSCNACHAEHAATDHVFTQFYPVLRDRM